MSMRLSLALPAIVLVLGLAVVGCTGGGGGDGTGDGQRVTDPARVPSSTPVRNGQPQLYQIHQDGSVAISGGPTLEATVPANGTPTSGDRTYVIQPGDLCGTIAEAHGITVAELIAANRASINADCTNLRPGESLRIPGPGGTGGGSSPPVTGTTPTPRAGSRTYEVRSGDTCADIAASFGVSTDALIALNGLDPGCRDLQPGQVLNIPG